ncbi:hypothetical protein T492DRAFT_1097946 [Pavlovales sp. CCMP2436]|nr:hypothetical protein T492DRAFT_1097946 [Pavlovales sp. CCMP2436]
MVRKSGAGPPPAVPSYVGARRNSKVSVPVPDVSPAKRALLRPQTPHVRSMLSPSDKTKAARIFTACDLDGSGLLEIEELIAVLKSLGHDVSVQRMREMIAPYGGANSGGALNLAEFEAMITSNGGTHMGRSRNELDAESLLEALGTSGPAETRAPATDSLAKLPAEKLEELEARLSKDFGLKVKIADLIEPPITEDKIRNFLVETNSGSPTM